MARVAWVSERGADSGRTVIEFSGTVGQVQQAFHTEIHKVVVNGKLHFANLTDLRIPVAFAPVISGAIGLHDFWPKSLLHRASQFHQHRATVLGQAPFVTFSAGCGPNGSDPCYAVAPADFATIYNVPPTIGGNPAGQGVTIAIVQDSNVNVSDIQQFRQLFNLPGNSTDSNVILNGPDPGVQGPNSASGDETEADLDVEWSGAVAPAATIDLVVSQNPQTLGAAGIDLSALYIINNNLAPIISESFGVCETGTGVNAFYSALWEQAAAQGITVAVSAGDNGSDVCDQLTANPNDFATTGLSISGLAATPFNVALGGTDFQNGAPPSSFWAMPGTSTGSAKSYIPESTWNNSCAASALVGSLASCTATLVNQDIANGDFLEVTAGSGGESAITTNAKPTWQAGVAPANDVRRDVPDISFFSAVNTSSNSFYIVCEADSPTQGGNACNLSSGQPVEITALGGTSAAAPAFAGIMALIVQQQGGERQGNANYVLYSLYKSNLGNATTICPSNVASVTATGCIFYDVVTGNNSVACQGGTSNCSNDTAGANQYGILVDPANPSTPAFSAVTGYDKATGLGSVNVANLLGVWNSASFSADTITITSFLTGTLAHGANANFTVSVTSGSGTPSGFVSLETTAPTGESETIGSFTTDTNNSFQLSSGSVTISTNLLPGGSPLKVVAAYSGDGTFAPGTSPAVSVNVNPEGSATAINLVTTTGTATSVAYGSNYILRVDVIGTGTGGGNPCSQFAVPCPTGQISLAANGNPLNDFSSATSSLPANAALLLNDLGFLEDQNIQLTPGSYGLVAAYAGDSSYSPSSSPALNVTISKATTTIAVISSAATIASGESVTLTATISTTSNGAGPTGTVQFHDGSTALGAPQTCAPAAATSTTPATCVATLATTLSSLMPQRIIHPTPRSLWTPLLPVGLILCALVLLFLISLGFFTRRVHGYVFAFLTLFGILIISIAGCGGSATGGTGGTGGNAMPQNQTITATYGGDGNYASSTSAAITITVNQ